MRLGIPSSSILLGVFFTASITSSAFATTHQVGKSKANSDLQAAFSKAKPGDIIEVDGDATYKGDAKLDESGKEGQPIVIRGISVGGKRPVISGGDYGVTLIGNYITFENFEITKIKGTGIATKGHEIQLRNLSVHDNVVHGILALDEDSGAITIEYSEIYKNGGDDKHHQVYIATDEEKYPGAVFRMQHCYIHDANGGVSVKSRAERTELFYNWIEGAKYQELDLIGADNSDSKTREDADIIGNVIRKTTPGAIARMGDDESGDNSASKGRYRFIHNTILLHQEGSFAFRAHGGIESIELHNNVIYRAKGAAFGFVREEDALWVAGSNVYGGNNWINAGVKVPAALSVIYGSDPGFRAFDKLDLVPTKESPLANSGNDAPQTSPKAPFPTLAITPMYVPQKKWVENASMRVLRTKRSKIDIGAFESDADETKKAVQPSSPPVGKKVKVLGGLGIAGIGALAVVLARRKRNG